MDINQRNSVNFMNGRFVVMSTQLKNYSNAESILKSVRSASSSFKNVVKGQNNSKPMTTKTSIGKNKDFVKMSNVLKVIK